MYCYVVAFCVSIYVSYRGENVPRRPYLREGGREGGRGAVSPPNYGPLFSAVLVALLQIRPLGEGGKGMG